MSERAFERANSHHGAFFVAGSAATAHRCPEKITTAEHESVRNQ